MVPSGVPHLADNHYYCRCLLKQFKSMLGRKGRTREQGGIHAVCKGLDLLLKL